MENMAAEGMKFTQAYATNVCSPSRISLMTGINAARHRVTNWTLHKGEMKTPEINHPFLDMPRWNVNGLALDASLEDAVFAKPLPQILKDNGYYTIHAGKAHFAAIGTEGEDPVNLGFDINIAGHAAGAPGSYKGEDHFKRSLGGPVSVWDVPGLEEFHGDAINLTEALTQKAIEAVSETPEDQPFFLYLSHYTVHTPIMGDRRFLNKYLKPGIDTTEAEYASMIESMDKSLGDVFTFLEENGLEENTIILFMSDNGGLSAVARGGEAHTHNAPLSSGKGSAREGGLRVPMMAWWPGKIEAGTVCEEAIIIEDFFSTIIEIAEAKADDIPQVVDGKSFSGQLFDNECNVSDRPLVWHFPNVWGPEGPGIGPFSAIRLGSWKLIYYHEDQSFELFNLDDDIEESNNLSVRHPDQLQLMAQSLTQYLKDTQAQMPLNKSSGEMIPYPLDAL